LHANSALVVHGDRNGVEGAIQAESFDADAVLNTESGAVIGAPENRAVRAQQIVTAMIQRQVLVGTCIDVGRQNARRSDDQDRKISRAGSDRFEAAFADVIGVAQDGSLGRRAAIAPPRVLYRDLPQDAFSTPR
jgi:hypothetical protein